MLNIRITDEIKTLIALEAIRDGRSMSQIALRAITLGLAAMAPKPTPQVETPKAPKTPKGKDKGDGGAAPAAPVKPRKK